MADAAATTAGAAPESSFAFLVNGSPTFAAELVDKLIAKPSLDGSDKLLVAPDSMRKLAVLTSLKLSSEPSVELRFFQMPSSGAEELQGSIKKLIRLETVEEGDYLVLRQRAEETTPAEKEEEAASGEETTPAEKEEEAAPGEEETTPAEKDEEAAPGEEETTPAEKEEEAAPGEETTPAEKEEEAAPGEEETTPAEKDEEAAPGEEETTPAEKEEEAAPGEEETTPAEKEEEAAPGEEETTPAEKDEEAAPAEESHVSPTEEELNEIIEREDKTAAPVPIPEDIVKRIVEAIDTSLPSGTDATVTTMAPDESLGDVESLDAPEESPEEGIEGDKPVELEATTEPEAAIKELEPEAKAEKEIEVETEVAAEEEGDEDKKPWSGIQSAIKRQVRWLDSIGKGIASFAPPTDGEAPEDVPPVVAWGQRNARVISAGACAILVAIAVATLSGGSRKRRS